MDRTDASQMMIEIMLTYCEQENPMIEKREGLRKKKDKEKTKRMLARLRKPVMTMMIKAMMTTTPR